MKRGVATTRANMRPEAQLIVTAVILLVVASVLGAHSSVEASFGPDRCKAKCFSQLTICLDLLPGAF